MNKIINTIRAKKNDQNAQKFPAAPSRTGRRDAERLSQPRTGAVPQKSRPVGPIEDRLITALYTAAERHHPRGQFLATALNALAPQVPFDVWTHVTPFLTTSDSANVAASSYSAASLDEREAMLADWADALKMERRVSSAGVDRPYSRFFADYSRRPSRSPTRDIILLHMLVDHAPTFPAPKELDNDRVMSLETLRKDPLMWPLLAQRLRHETTFQRDAVRFNADVVAHLADALELNPGCRYKFELYESVDRQCLRIAVTADPRYLTRLPPDLLLDSALVEPAIAKLRHNTDMIRDYPDFFYDSESYMLAMQKRHERAFNYASPRLQASESFICESVVSNLNGWKHFPDAILTKTRMLRMVETDGMRYQYLEHLRGEGYTDVAKAAVMQNPMVVTKIATTRPDYEDLLIFAAKLDAQIAKYISLALRGNRALAQICVRQDGDLLWIFPHFENDLEIVRDAVKQKGMALRHAGKKAQSNLTCVLIAIAQDEQACFLARGAAARDARVKHHCKVTVRL